MSIESFEAFMQRLSEDDGLREELRAQAPEGLSFDELAQAAASRGFSFSAEELAGAEDRELSDQQLEGVAGGAGFFKLSSPFNITSIAQKIIDSSNVHKLGSMVFKF